MQRADKHVLVGECTRMSYPSVSRCASVGPYVVARRCAAETVDVNLTASRGHAEWLDIAADMFRVRQSTLVALAVTFLARNFKI